MKDGRLVYSTDAGKMCPGCGKSTAQCTCAGKKHSTPKQPHPQDGVVRVQREVKGRKGKTVTTISGVLLSEKKLVHFAKQLKQRCGAGGSVKDGVIVIQGDHRQALLEILKEEGWQAKIAGG